MQGNLNYVLIILCMSFEIEPSTVAGNHLQIKKITYNIYIIVLYLPMNPRSHPTGTLLWHENYAPYKLKSGRPLVHHAHIFYRYTLFFLFFVTVIVFRICRTRTHFRRTNRFGAAAVCRDNGVRRAKLDFDRRQLNL